MHIKVLNRIKQNKIEMFNYKSPPGGPNLQKKSRSTREKMKQTDVERMSFRLLSNLAGEEKLNAEGKTKRLSCVWGHKGSHGRGKTDVPRMLFRRGSKLVRFLTQIEHKQAMMNIC